MRVLYLNPCGQLGGAETSLRELLASVREAVPRWELWLVLGEDGPLVEQAKKLGVRVLVVPFPPAVARLGDTGIRPLAMLKQLPSAALATIRYKIRLHQIVQSIQPHLIHTNGFKMHLLGAWTRPRGTPLVWHIHDYVSKRSLMSRLLRLFHRNCSVAVVNSKSVARDLEGLLTDLRVVPIYNAVNLERFSPVGTKADLDAMSGLSPAAPGVVRVGLVATFARWKGHRVFLRALARLGSDASIRGYIIGGAIYQTHGSQWLREELEHEAAQLGLGGKVGFTGFLPDTSAAMRSLDVVVHASTEPEPFGMVIIEGMACGAAVIASQAGGASELFEDGETALAHAPGDDGMLAQQILRLAGDRELRQRMGKAGRAAVEQHYRAARLAQELLAVYRGLVETPVEVRSPQARSSFRVAGQ